MALLRSVGVNHVLEINLVKAKIFIFLNIKIRNCYLFPNLRVLRNEFMTISEIDRFKNNVKMKIKSQLTEPVLGRKDISPLVEDNIEDDHYANTGVERDQSFPRGKLSFLMDNHEDEKDDDSGYKIH